MKTLKNAIIEDDIYILSGDLSIMLNRSQKTISNYADAGMPSKTFEGKKYRYFPIRKCMEWLYKNGYLEIEMPMQDYTDFENMDMMEAKRRQDVSRAKLLEMEVAEQEGKFIEVDKARKEIVKVLTAFKARVLAMPSTIAPSILTCQSVAEANAMIEDACYNALNELGRLDVDKL